MKLVKIERIHTASTESRSTRKGLQDKSQTQEPSDLGMRTRRRACGQTVRAIGPALGLLMTLLARCGGVIVTSVKPNRGSLAGGTRLHIQVFQCVPICVPCAPCCTPPRERVLGSDAWGAARCANVGSRAAQPGSDVQDAADVQT